MSSRIETIENRLRLENSVFPMVFLYFFLAKITSSSKEIEKNEEINPLFFQTKIKKIKRKTKGKTAAPGFVTFADKKNKRTLTNT